MHFTCTECRFQFCGDCNGEFIAANVCPLVDLTSFLLLDLHPIVAFVGKLRLSQNEVILFLSFVLALSRFFSISHSHKQ